MTTVSKWIAGLALLMVLPVTGAFAQATRTWVSGVGDDANPCSRTAPCKTFAGAISKTAAGGEIDALDPGGFGAVTITKAMTIDGGGGIIAGVLVSGTNAIIVNAGVNDVVILRNLDINGLGTSLSGIRFLAGKALIVENSTIYGFTTGIEFVPGTNASLTVGNTLVRNTSGGGLIVKPNASFFASATITDSRFESGLFGVKAEDRGAITAKNSIARGNVNSGFIASSASEAAEVNLESCVSSSNGVGVGSVGALAVARISNTFVTDNASGLVAMSGAIQSFLNNRIVGNTTNGAATLNLAQQ